MSTHEVPAKQIVIDNLEITIWNEGRVYYRELEEYRPKFSYSIVSPDWRYDANDIEGAPNQPPDLDSAAFVLLILLNECASCSDDSDNANLFPKHVREAIVSASSEINAVCNAMIQERG